MDLMNIRIRGAEPGDSQAMQRIYGQTKVIRDTFQLPFPGAEAWRRRLAEKSDKTHFLVACCDEELVGCLVLSVNIAARCRHVGEISLVISDDWQGKDVESALMSSAIELADRWLALTRLEVTVFTDSETAIEFYERFGFQKEGRFEKYAFRDGKLADVYPMARVTHT